MRSEFAWYWQPWRVRFTILRCDGSEKNLHRIVFVRTPEEMGRYIALQRHQLRDAEVSAVCSVAVPLRGTAY